MGYFRERFELPDSDFVDVDWVQSDRTGLGPQPCLLILHGLEGSSHSPYVVSMARTLSRAGYQVGALNLRGCSGEPNRLPRFYHSGDTEGLDTVVEAVCQRFETVNLAGFSLGGNVLLKYLGEDPSRVPQAVTAVATFSVPCDLASSADRLAEPGNAFYMKRFIRLLGAKLREKEKLYPRYRYEKAYLGMKSFHEFDEFYTAPLNGFRDAADYWNQSSSLRYLDRIERPTLLVNAQNDPFLSEACYPSALARSSPHFHLEVPAAGGHCGFPGRGSPLGYWHELRALAFFKEYS